MKNDLIITGWGWKEYAVAAAAALRALKGEAEVVGMSKRRLPELLDPEMREIAVKNLEQMRETTRDMIASFKGAYKVMMESEANMAELMKEAE